MGLNNIQLTDQLLSDLYADVLIETKIATSVYAEQQPVKYLGNNASNILLLVNHPSVPYLTDGELSFLTNILSACKLSLADVAVLNIHALQESDIENALQVLEPRNVILFGIPPLSAGLPINFPLFQLQPFNKRTYLYGPPLKELQSDKTLKSRLWNCLKIMFDVQ